MYMCDRIFDFIHFYDFLVGFCNCFDGVVFSVLYFSFQYCLIKCVCLEKNPIEIILSLCPLNTCVSILLFSFGRWVIGIAGQKNECSHFYQLNIFFLYLQFVPLFVYGAAIMNIFIQATI